MRAIVETERGKGGLATDLPSCLFIKDDLKLSPLPTTRAMRSHGDWPVGTRGEKRWLVSGLVHQCLVNKTS